MKPAESTRSSLDRGAPDDERVVAMRDRVPKLTRDLSDASGGERFWQIPKSFDASAGHEQNPAAALDRKQRPRQSNGFGLYAFRRQLELRAVSPRFTKGPQRAFAAVRIL